MSDYGERCVVQGEGSGNISPVCRGRWEGLMLRRSIREGVERRGVLVHCRHCGADVTARFSAEVWAQVGVNGVGANPGSRILRRHPSQA